MRKNKIKEQKKLTDIGMTPLKEAIEEIFNPYNIDDACEGIARKMREYKDMMNSDIVSGDIATAVTIFLEIAESLAYHFVEDEHYNYFDDYYSPDYEIRDMLDAFIKADKEGLLSEQEKQRITEGIARLQKTESYKEYGAPMFLDEWNRYLYK